MFPLFALAGSVTSVTLTKAEGSTADAPITFGELVSVTTSEREYTWYGWVDGSDFTYKAYKLVNGQFSAEPSYSGDGSAPAPTSDGVYQITVSRPYYQSYGYQQEAGTVVPFNPGDGTWEADKLYTVTTPAQTNPSGGIDVNEIVGNLQVNALSQKKYWGQLDPEPRFNITNGWNRIISPEAINLDPSTISMFRNDGEAPGQYAWNVNVVDAVYDYPGVTLISGTGDFLIIKKVPVNETSLFDIAAIPDQTYTGEPIEPGVTITYHRAEQFGGDLTLTEGTDYTLEYENNVEPGWATVKITGTGTYFENTTTTTFNIVAAELADDAWTVEASPISFVYDADEHAPETFVVKVGTEVLDPDYYDVTVNEQTEVGNYKYTVTLKDRYTGEKEGDWAITAVNIADLDITVASAGAYTSQEKKPAVTVKFNGETVNAEQYTVAYENNIDAGTEAKAIITAVEGGNFTGSKTVNFTITKRDLSTTGIQNDEPKLKALTWHCEEQQAEITSCGFYQHQIPDLLENPLKVTYVYQVIDNSQEVEAITNAGIYEVIFTADENEPNFKGSKTVRVEVAKAELTAKVKDITVGYGTDWKSQYELVPAEGLSDAIKAAIKAATKAEKFSTNVETPNVGTYEIYYDAERMSDNFNLEVTNGTLNITKAQVWANIIVKNENEVYADNIVNYGEPYEFGLAYNSGLIALVDDTREPAEVFAELIAQANPEFKVYKGDELLEANPTDAGDYKVTAAAFELENYLVLVQDGNYKIKGIDISELADVRIETGSGLVYNGKAQEPAYTVYLNGELLSPEVYDGVFANNKNATTEESKASLTVTFKGGNYEGEIVEFFEIGQRPINAVAIADEADYYEIVEGTATYEKGAKLDAPEDEVAMEENLNDLLGSKDNVKVTFATGIPTTAGEHPGALKAELTEAGLANEVLKNYTITFKNGTLTINKAKVVMELADIDVTYGEPVDESIIPEGYKPTYKSGLNSQSEIDAVYSLITNFKYTLPEPEEDGRYVVGGEYFITATADATNYEVEILPGKVNITKRDVTVTPIAQTIEFGEDIDPTKYEVNGVAYQDQLVIELVCTETAVGFHEGAITVKADPDADPNFNYNIIVAGAADLTINGKTLIALERGRSDDAVINLLEGYNGKFVDVTIGGSNLKNVDYWYSFCLPFQTTVREISNAFGYAVVDVPDVTNTKEGKVVFKLKVDAEPIAANTLILIKLDEPRNLAENPVKFNLVVKNDDESINEEKSRKIDYNPEFVVEDAAGNSFVPTYTRVDLKNDGEWYLQQGTFYNAGALEAGTNVKSLQGYFNAVGGAGARIFVQEADGTMTAINSATINAVAAEGWYTIDGMKLNAQPTQKGVYINNGKKVVVK